VPSSLPAMSSALPQVGSPPEASGGPRPPTARVRGALIATAVAAAYVVLAGGAFWRVWSSHPTSYMQLGGDQWRNVWFLGWLPFALGHAHFPLYSGYVNVPVGVNLLSAAGIPALGFLFSPVTVIWGAIASYNVASTLALASSAMAAYALARRFTTWRPAAFAAGLLYGFSPDLVAQAQGHLNLSFCPVPPLIFLALHELLVRQAWGAKRTGFLLGVLVTVQFFISSEILFDTVVVGAVVVVCLLVVGRRRLGGHWHHAATGGAAAVVTALVLLGFPLWWMLDGSAHVVGKLDLVPQAYRADLLGPLIPDSLQLITFGTRLTAHADHFATSAAENGSYLGIPLLVVLAVAVVALRRRAVAVVAAAGGVAAFVLSLGAHLAVAGTPRLGPNGTAAGGIPLPEAVFSHLPVLDNVEPVRFSVLMDLAAAVVLACALDAAYRWLRGGRHRRGRRPAATLAAAAVAAVALVPVIPAVPFAGIGFDGTPAYFRSPAVAALHPGEVAVVFPFPSGAYPPAMLWQEQSGFRFKMVGGDFIVPQGPGDHVAFSPLLAYAPSSLTADTLTQLAQGTPVPESPALHAQLRAEMRAFGVGALVAVPAYAQDPARAQAFLTWLLGRPSYRGGGVVAWYGVR